MEHSFELRLADKQETIDRVLIPLTTRNSHTDGQRPQLLEADSLLTSKRYECLSKSMNADQVLAASGCPASAS
jgi:hypothetical protein